MPLLQKKIHAKGRKADLLLKEVRKDTGVAKKTKTNHIKSF